jgi:uncharacterized membrane protein
VGSTLLTVALLGLRISRTHNAVFFFLAWNLLLAWLPLLASQAVTALAARRGPSWAVWVGAGVWLALFPNAPYVVTDLIHLHPREGVPMWFDAALLFSAAWTGMALGCVSLSQMQAWVTRARGARAGWLMALGVLGLSAVGIGLGRFERWNSWDLVSAPMAIAADVFSPLGKPERLGFTALFAGLQVCAYLTLRRAHPEDGATP